MLRRESSFGSVLLAALLLGLPSCGDGTGPESGPSITALAPNRITPAAGSFYVTLRGSGFADNSVVLLNGSPRETLFESDTGLNVFILYSDIAAPGTVFLQVVNPDNQRSHRMPFVIAPDATSLAVKSLVPASEGEASPGTLVTVYFNEALDQASLSDTSLTLRDENGPVPGSISYDADAWSLTLSAQLAPARQFTAHISDEIQSVSRGFTGARDWTFSTSLGPSIVLDSLSGWPSLVLGTDGRPRAAYFSGFTKRLKLAACQADCSRLEGWGFSIIDQTVNSGSYVSVARDAQGKLHYGYEDFEGAAIYSAGASQRTTVEAGGVGAFTTIAAAPSGVIHLMYYGHGDLRSARCSPECQDPVHWTLSTVDADGNAGSFGSVAVDAGGGVHVTYYENDAGDLRYATCPAPCIVPTWTSGSIATQGHVGIGSSLVIDGAGRLHATWLDVTENTVMYGTCAASCTLTGNWSTAAVERVATMPVDYGFYYTSLALGPAGKLEASYLLPEQGLLRGASCASSCATPGTWSTFTVSFQVARPFGFWMTSLEVGNDGQRHVVWTAKEGQLRYTRY